MLRKRRKFKPLQSNEKFVKYRNGVMKKDTLYKARKNKQQKTLKLKRWIKHVN